MVGSGGHLVGPDGIGVDAVELAAEDVAYARRGHPDAQAGQVWFLVTRHGRLVAYCRDIEEVAEHVDLRALRGPDAAAEDAG